MSDRRDPLLANPYTSSDMVAGLRIHGLVIHRSPMRSRSVGVSYWCQTAGPRTVATFGWLASHADLDRTGPSAWESDRPGLLTALTWTFDAPLLTVMDPVTPGLMAVNGPWPDG
jgi:hypothetical protein